MAAMVGPEEPGVGAEQSLAARISTAVVQLMHSYTGRGPTRAWTSIDAELVTVVLRDALTKGERSLVADGETELVLQMRSAYQRTMQASLVASVERLTGRTVVAFMSANHVDPDIAIESFILDRGLDADPVDGPNGDGAA